eukprot:3367409-Pleurochrysis_carterae.AAC.1
MSDFLEGSKEEEAQGRLLRRWRELDRQAGGQRREREREKGVGRGGGADEMSQAADEMSQGR